MSVGIVRECVYEPDTYDVLIDGKAAGTIERRVGTVFWGYFPKVGQYTITASDLQYCVDAVAIMYRCKFTIERKRL